MKFLMTMAALTMPMVAMAAEPIDYRLSVTAAKPVPVVTMTLRLRGDGDGETDLDLPNAWAGSDKLWRNIGGWRVTGGTITDTDKPGVKRIRHQPGDDPLPCHRSRSVAARTKF